MTVPAYTQLRNDIITGVVTIAGGSLSQILSTLKYHYKEKINSPRRYEQINSLDDLLTVLEIRAELSEDNVEPLKVIAESITNNNERNKLLQKIASYEESYEPREYVNFYENANQINSPYVQGAARSSNVYGINLTPVKRQRITSILIEEIGSSWRDLGRNLKVRECDIEEIDINFRSVGKKTAEVLYKFERRADPQRWFFTLCNALDKTRRGDLVKSLQEENPIYREQMLHRNEIYFIYEDPVK